MRICAMLSLKSAADLRWQIATDWLEAAQRKGHRVQFVFFYHAAAYAALNLAEAESRRWQALAQHDDAVLMLCRTGLAQAGLSPSEATLPEPWRLGGLSQYLAAMQAADRVVSF